MLIGILEAGHAPGGLVPGGGGYPRLFERLLDGQGFDFRTWSVVDMDFPDGPEAADGWLITGSRHGAYDDLPFIAPLEDLIRAIHAAGRPLVGICFGHQIVAQALGGRVEKFAGGWAVGRSVYDWGGEPVALNAWHQDQVTALPPGAQVLARSDFCEAAALAIGERILTIQAHPEFGRAEIEGLIALRGAVVGPKVIDAAEAALERPTDSARIADRIGAVLRGAAAR